VFRYDVENEKGDLKSWLGQADVVFHLAGINRPQSDEEFETGNAGFTDEICTILRQLRPAFYSAYIGRGDLCFDIGAGLGETVNLLTPVNRQI
jgi:hypothetical protein